MYQICLSKCRSMNSCSSITLILYLSQCPVLMLLAVYSTHNTAMRQTKDHGAPTLLSAALSFNALSVSVCHVLRSYLRRHAIYIAWKWHGITLLAQKKKKNHLLPFSAVGSPPPLLLFSSTFKVSQFLSCHVHTPNECEPKLLYAILFGTWAKVDCCDANLHAF